MKNLFHPENPVMQFLSRVGDLIIVNALFLLCCLPVVTAGAAQAALHRVTQSMVMEEDGGVVKPFFRAFRDNFKQATLGWLVVVLFLAGLVADWMLALSYLTGGALSVARGVCLVVAIFVVALGDYYFLLIARYENTIRQHTMNAVILTVAKLPRTVLLVALTLLPLLIALVSMQTFVYTLVFWFMLGFACVSYLQASIMRPVFRQLEKTEEKEQEENSHDQPEPAPAPGLLHPRGQVRVYPAEWPVAVCLLPQGDGGTGGNYPLGLRPRALLLAAAGL